MKRKKLHDDDAVAAKSNVSGPEGERLEVSRGGRGCLKGRISGPHKPNGRAATLLTSKWGEDIVKVLLWAAQRGQQQMLVGLHSSDNRGDLHEGNESSPLPYQRARGVA